MYKLITLPGKGNLLINPTSKQLHCSLESNAQCIQVISHITGAETPSEWEGRDGMCYILVCVSVII